MDLASLTASGKLIMILICLYAMPKTKETLMIDVISDKGVTETFVAKPTADGFNLSQNGQTSTEKMTDGHRDGFPTSFVVSDTKRKIGMEEFFQLADLKNISTASKMELKADGIGSFKVTRSGGTAYVTGPTGVTFSIHK
jgi:hypothetical protein